MKPNPKRGSNSKLIFCIDILEMNTPINMEINRVPVKAAIMDIKVRHYYETRNNALTHAFNH